MNRISKISALCFALGMLLMFSACDETSDFEIDYKYGYYPAELGHYVIYNVDSIVYNDNTSSVDSFHYQVKHVIDSTFPDNEGREAYRLVRYKRADESQPWSLIDVWSFVPTTNTLEVSEENVKFVKLLFPPKKDQTWDGNKYVNEDDNWWFWKPIPWEYTVTELDVPMIIGQLQFDSTLTVLQQDEESLIQKVNSVEKYAKNVGLIYKYFLALDKSKGDISRPWTDPDFGFIFTMTIVEYGQE